MARQKPQGRLTTPAIRTWLTVHEVAEIVGLHPDSIHRLTRRGRFLPPTKVGSASRWDRDELQDWLKQGGSRQAPRVAATEARA